MKSPLSKNLFMAVVMLGGLTGCSLMPWSTPPAQAPASPAVPPPQRAVAATAPRVEVPPPIGDCQKSAVQQKLSEDARSSGWSVVSQKDASLRITIASDPVFEWDTAQLRPEALRPLALLATVLQSCEQGVIHVLGYVEGIADAGLSQSLSERRAASVVAFMTMRGVDAARMRHEGRGHQKRSRRIEVVIRPIVAGREAAAWLPPS